jgi:hypothetical protein
VSIVRDDARDAACLREAAQVRKPVLAVRFADYIGLRPLLGEGVVLMTPYSEPLSHSCGL